MPVKPNVASIERDRNGCSMNVQTREDTRYGFATDVLQSLGTLRLQASGASMLPTLWPGDLLTIHSKTPAEVQVGDLVLCMRQGRFFVHRLIRKSSLGGELVLITRGDSMPQEDPPVAEKDLLGVVTSIRRCGSSVELCRTLSPLRLILAQILCYSDLCWRGVSRFHARRIGNYDLGLPARGNAW